jgi:hypothetical protein
VSQVSPNTTLESKRIEGDTMKNLTMVCICLGALAGPAMAGVLVSPQFRVWTDNTGQFCVTAVFVDLHGDLLRLKRQDGTVIAVPITRLSELDRRYVVVFQSPPRKEGVGVPGALRGKKSSPQDMLEGLWRVKPLPVKQLPWHEPSASTKTVDPGWVVKIERDKATLLCAAVDEEKVKQ